MCHLPAGGSGHSRPCVWPITQHPWERPLGQKKPTRRAKQSVVAQPGLPVMAALKEGVLLALPCYGGGSAQAGGKRVPGRQA